MTRISNTGSGSGGVGVPGSRAINTTAPLSGGGDLSADRTLTTAINTNKLIGRGTAGVGVMEEITLGTNLSFTGTTLNATGGGTPANPATSIQFNDTGVFGGSADLTFNKATLALNIAATDVSSSINSGGVLAINVGGDGEPFSINTANGTTNNSTGGAINITAGNGSLSGGNTNGGSFSFTAGNAGSGNALGGNFSFYGGLGKGSSVGGYVLFVGGDGDASGSGDGGYALFEGGRGGATGNGGDTNFQGGRGGLTSGNGGNVFLTAGNAQTSGNGGNVDLQAGVGAGGGSNGNIRFIDSTSTIGGIVDTSLLASSNKIFTLPNQTGLLMVPFIDRSTAQTAAKTLTAYTVGSADASFIVSANVLVTTATSHNFIVTCAYTDEGNTARTLTFTFSNVGGTLGTLITNAGGAVPHEGIPLHIRAKASTTITIASANGGGTNFSSVTYNLEGAITQLS